MPVYLTTASLIINKKAIEKKYNGGIKQFRIDYFNHESKASQEDDEVFLIARMGCDSYNLDEWISMGFEYDKTKGFSNDFVIHQRYHGYFWQVNWLEDNSFYAWHTKTNDQLSSKAKLFGAITVEEFEKVFENGLEIPIPLTMENVNTHPLSRLLDILNKTNNEYHND